MHVSSHISPSEMHFMMFNIGTFWTKTTSQVTPLRLRGDATPAAARMELHATCGFNMRYCNHLNWELNVVQHDSTISCFSMKLDLLVPSAQLLNGENRALHSNHKMKIKDLSRNSKYPWIWLDLARWSQISSQESQPPSRAPSVAQRCPAPGERMWVKSSCPTWALPSSLSPWCIALAWKCLRSPGVPTTPGGAAVVTHWLI